MEINFFKIIKGRFIHTQVEIRNGLTFMRRKIRRVKNVKED